MLTVGEFFYCLGLHINKDKCLSLSESSLWPNRIGPEITNSFSLFRISRGKVANVWFFNSASLLPKIISISTFLNLVQFLELEFSNFLVCLSLRIIKKDQYALLFQGSIQDYQIICATVGWAKNFKTFSVVSGVAEEKCLLHLFGTVFSYGTKLSMQIYF